MHNNLNILEMKRVLELQPFIPNANRLNVWQLNNLSYRLKDNRFLFYIELNEFKQ